MANVPKDLLEQIAELEKLFTVGQDKLITITDHFVKELEKGTLIFDNVLTIGLTKKGGSIVCCAV